MTARYNITNKVFSRFKRIPDQAYHDYIAFYTNYFNQIQRLKFREYAEIKFHYIRSLHALDQVHAFHKCADDLIAELLNQEDFDEYYKNLYRQTLLLKSLVLISELRHGEGRKILEELYKLNPKDKAVRRLLFRQLFHETLHNYRRWFGVNILLLIFSLMATGIYFLFLKSFYPQWQPAAEWMRNFAFGSSVAFFVVFHLLIYRRVKNHLRAIKETRMLARK